MIRIDRDWLRAHPLPPVDVQTDKNARGRVLAVGGSAMVPGALMLTGEAALRAGAGKLQMATVRDAVIPLGMAMPEAAVIPLEIDPGGEINGPAALDRLVSAARSCHALVLGPGMSESEGHAALLTGLVEALDAHAVALLDAAAIAACRDCTSAIHALGGRVVLTPHVGEMAQLTGRDADWISDNLEDSATAAAEDLGAVIVLKSARTLIAAPGEEPLDYGGGGPGLATGGSGDVLAGIAAGLLAQGVAPRLAAAWAVWVHGEAGSLMTARLGGPGLLARELLAFIPELLYSPATRT